MKNILKLSLLTVGIALSSTLLAQEGIKKEAATTADKLEAPKATETKTDAKTDKQDPAKTTPGSSTSTPTPAKTDAKADTTKTDGGTRMAISEQGTPKKNKNKGKTATTTTAPPAKKEAPKK